MLGPAAALFALFNGCIAGIVSLMTGRALSSLAEPGSADCIAAAIGDNAILLLTGIGDVWHEPDSLTATISIGALLVLWLSKR